MRTLNYIKVRPPMERFMNKVMKTNTCWIWLGATSHGYGRFREVNTTVLAHRWMYEQIHGSIGSLFCCHSCDNPSCVNPNHMFIGTPKDNMIDKANKGRHHNSKVTHCPRGHEYTEDNTYTNNGRRNCKICITESGRTYYRLNLAVKIKPIKINFK